MEIRKTGVPGFEGAQRHSINSLGKTDKELSKVLQQLSSAKRINQAADDAAGLAVAEQLSTQARGFKMASDNVAYAQSALNIAESTAQEVDGMLQRQRELAIQSKNGTLNDEQRQSLDKEFQQLTKEIDRTAGSTTYNRQTVANGQDLASGTSQVQAGPNPGDTISLPQVNLTAGALGTSNLSIAQQQSAGEALDELDSALENVHTQQSSIGAMTNRIESAFNNLEVAEVNTQAAESVLRDKDMVSGLAEMTRSRLLQEVENKSFQRFNEIGMNHIINLLQ